MNLSAYSYDPLLLRPWMMKELTSRGVAEDVAQHIVSSVIETSLRGVDSHGINLFPHYCSVADSGRINLSPKLQFSRRSKSLGVLDADWTYGHYAGAVAMQYAQKMAMETGFALVNVQNSSHFGAAAYSALRAAREGFIAFAFTNADALVKAHNAVGSFFGTNPICFTAPLSDEDPLCLDMATSQVSWNKVKNYRLEKRPLESGWAYDNNGFDVTDPNFAVTLAPAGCYKGFGLGLMVEVLCSLLACGPIAKDIQPMFKDISHRRQISHCFIALDIAQISELDVFRRNLTDMVHRIRSMQSLGNEDVMAPGDPEKKVFAQRSCSGIPVNGVIHADFQRINPAIESVIKV